MNLLRSARGETRLARDRSRRILSPLRIHPPGERAISPSLGCGRPPGHRPAHTCRAFMHPIPAPGTVCLPSPFHPWHDITPAPTTGVVTAILEIPAHGSKVRADKELGVSARPSPAQRRALPWRLRFYPADAGR